MRSSLDIMSESLDMKIDVLKEIEKYNDIQKVAFEEGNANMDSFDEAIEEKGRLIEKLEKLDEGFESIYEGLAEELKENRVKYKDEIAKLQDKIKLITELSVAVQTSEVRNKKLVEEYFAKERQGIKTGRVGSKAAFDYYKNMSGMNVSSPQFMDSKK